MTPAFLKPEKDGNNPQKRDSIWMFGVFESLGYLQPTLTDHKYNLNKIGGPNEVCIHILLLMCHVVHCSYKLNVSNVQMSHIGTR